MKKQSEQPLQHCESTSFPEFEKIPIQSSLLENCVPLKNIQTLEISKV